MTVQQTWTLLEILSNQINSVKGHKQDIFYLSLPLHYVRCFENLVDKIHGAYIFVRINVKLTKLVSFLQFTIKVMY